MRQKAQKDRRFSGMWERVLKAVSVFAFNTSTLVGLEFLIVLMQFLGVNGSFYNDESSSSDVTSGYELSHTIGHAAASSLAMLLLGNYFSRRIIEKGNSPKGRPKGSKNRRRQHKTVSALFDEYGPIFFRRAFRMDQTSFWTLLDLIEPKMGGKPKRKRGRTPNGDIANSARLAMAIRYFAGGDPLDICVVFGVTKEAVYRSAWIVVDAIHQTKTLNISYPTKHEEQLKVAQEFKKNSKAQFDNCAGCIDGILIWINKPSSKDLDTKLKCGSKKFFCGRKKKFGLNMQAVCDSRRRFLDVNIGYPGSTSDYLAFAVSSLQKKWRETIHMTTANHFCVQD